MASIGISWDHLSPTEFEEFCYDLLHDLGFANIVWRKGTGFDSSPSDQGRDLECCFYWQSPDGASHEGHCFVECKHYNNKRGVPPEKLTGILTWALSEQPDLLLIITSSFISNQARNYINKFIKDHNLRSRIDIWDNKKLKVKVETRYSLLRKYSIGVGLPKLHLLHPTHIEYLFSTHTNSLGFLLDTLNKLDPDKRDDILGWAYIFIVNPKFRKPENELETIGELCMDRVDFYSFKEKCLKSKVDDSILVDGIVSFVISTLLRHGDLTMINERRAEHKWLLDYYIEKQKVESSTTRSKLIRYEENNYNNITEITNKYYELYTYFCENVIKDLLTEKIPVPSTPPWE
ncbi:MAG: restriction endonuclease [Armatimonadota bacterium]